MEYNLFQINSGGNKVAPNNASKKMQTLQPSFIFLAVFFADSNNWTCHIIEMSL